MMWGWLAGFALFFAGGVAHAQSANEGDSLLESCFHAARVADAGLLLKFHQGGCPLRSHVKSFRCDRCR